MPRTSQIPLREEGLRKLVSLGHNSHINRAPQTLHPPALFKMTTATLVTSTVNTELLLFLVSNLSATATTVSAQSISRSDIFDNDDEMSQCWDMLHFTTQEELAADVSAVLTGINDDLDFLL